MELFRQLGLDPAQVELDWEMTPAATYGLFECRGDITGRVHSSRERYLYFYIDSWGPEPVLCLMERGIRHARVLARIKAPAALLAAAVEAQGRSWKHKSYAIDGGIRAWLEAEVLEDATGRYLAPVAACGGTSPETGLPGPADVLPAVAPVLLRAQPRVLAEADLPALIAARNFFEASHNPCGCFPLQLVDNQDGLTLTERVTGLVWQRDGHDETVSFLRLGRWRGEVNRAGLAGHHDWRLPTLDEALSLLTPEKNACGLHLPPGFSPRQAFIYTSDTHKPGGYWYVDFRQAKAFWAGGTLAGGFGRLCRSVGPEPSCQCRPVSS
ncbi:MAG: DUF1566 domain-containing protein [Thermodesulfobacteriota bacterium]